MISNTSDYIHFLSSSNGGKIHGLLMRKGKQILVKKYKEFDKIVEEKRVIIPLDIKDKFKLKRKHLSADLALIKNGKIVSVVECGDTDKNKAKVFNEMKFDFIHLPYNLGNSQEGLNSELTQTLLSELSFYEKKTSELEFQISNLEEKFMKSRMKAQILLNYVNALFEEEFSINYTFSGIIDELNKKLKKNKFYNIEYTFENFNCKEGLNDTDLLHDSTFYSVLNEVEKEIKFKPKKITRKSD